MFHILQFILLYLMDILCMVHILGEKGVSMLIGKKAGPTTKVTRATGEKTRLDTDLYEAICSKCGEVYVCTPGDVKRKSVICSCIVDPTVLDTERPEYYVWASMKQRCQNPNNRFYKHYGGRGIQVCEEWQSFRGFLDSMGERPGSSYTLERIDNNSGYCESNCRWATMKEQASNSRSKGLPEGVVLVGEGLYQARPEINGAKLYLGTFSTPRKAGSAIRHMRGWEGWKPDRATNNRGSSKYRGVSFDKQKGKWKAYAPNSGRFIKLCNTEEAARLAVENYFNKR